ncbi:MAG: MotA/TolQ/ExbB proton channel family protein [Verrucomicrobiota bacterium]
MMRLVPLSLRTIGLSILLFPSTWLYGQSASEVTQGKSLFRLIYEGGWTMVPLAICSVFMLFLVFYCWQETERKKFFPESVIDELKELLRKRDTGEANEVLSEFDTVLSRTMAPALDKARPDLANANRPKVEAVLVEGLELEESSLAQWVNYLNVVATISPMIGLLGTVSGMIGAFQTISGGGMGRPELLAGDIGEALITTATGLAIGIPAMIFYFVMRNRLANQMAATVQVASSLVEELAGDDED